MADYSFSSSRVRQVASEVRGTDATNIETCKNNVVNLANSVETSWQGTDAAAYIDALQKYGPEIQKLAETLKAIATTLDKIADIMDEREQQRRQAAQQQLSAN